MRALRSRIRFSSDARSRSDRAAIITNESIFAVGTALWGSPPHRSQRALLTHWAPASGSGHETHFGIGMPNAGLRKPSGHEAEHPNPGQPMPLAATPERATPVPTHL